MTGETLEGRDDATRPLPAATRWASAAVALGVATALGHALSYGFSLVLSRALGPADFGALGALLGLSVVAAVPASALQTQVARHCTVSPGRAALRQGYRLSWLLGLAVAAGVAVLSVPLSAVLRLDGALSVLLLAAGLLPVSVIAARQGVLLGRGAFGMLALTTVLVPALRLVGAGAAASADLGLTGALGLQAVATWVAVAAVVALVAPQTAKAEDDAADVAPDVADVAAPDLPDHREPRDRTTRSAGPQLRGVAAAGASLLGLFVLANVDVLLARIFLTDTESGIYAVGALGAKVVFWGSQFVALLVFPHVTRGRAGTRLVASAGAMIAAVGGAVALVSVPLATPVLDLLVGSAYADAASVLPWFVVLGTLLALVQLLTYAAVATAEHRFSALLWGTVLAQALVIALVAHDDIQQVVTVCILGTGLLAVVSATLVRRAHP